MKIHNTGDATVKPSIVMLVYGQGGVGKTTFCATAPNPIIADCENGAKYFGLRGIKVDVAEISGWPDINEFYKYVSKSDHETIVVDPIGELMEKLKIHLVSSNNKKFVQSDGSLTMNGWGEMKDRMRQFIKSARDLNKHLIIVAHVEEKDDEGKLIKRPKIMTKMSEELVAMVDVVGFMEVVKTVDANGDAVEKRIIRVQPSDKYESKDRTGQLGGIIEPDFTKIINACQGTETYHWSSAKAKSTATEIAPAPAPATNAEVKTVAKPVTANTSQMIKGTLIERIGSLNTYQSLIEAKEKLATIVRLNDEDRAEVADLLDIKIDIFKPVEVENPEDEPEEQAEETKTTKTKKTK